MEINWQAAGVLVAVVGAGVAGYFSYSAKEQSEAANKLAKSSQEMVIEAQRLETASRVDLGEMPPNTGFSETHARSDTPILALLNTSPNEVNLVWIEGHLRGQSGRKVYVIGTVPACTMYTIQDNLSPDRIDYADTRDHWTRDRSGVPVPGDKAQLPAKSDQLPTPAYWNSGVPVAVPNCTI